MDSLFTKRSELQVKLEYEAAFVPGGSSVSHKYPAHIAISQYRSTTLEFEEVQQLIKKKTPEQRHTLNLPRPTSTSVAALESPQSYHAEKEAYKTHPQDDNMPTSSAAAHSTNVPQKWSATLPLGQNEKALNGKLKKINAVLKIANQRFEKAEAARLKQERAETLEALDQVQELTAELKTARPAPPLKQITRGRTERRAVDDEPLPLRRSSRLRETGGDHHRGRSMSPRNRSLSPTRKRSPPTLRSRSTLKSEGVGRDDRKVKDEASAGHEEGGKEGGEKGGLG